MSRGEPDWRNNQIERESLTKELLKYTSDIRIIPRRDNLQLLDEHYNLTKGSDYISD